MFAVLMSVLAMLPNCVAVPVDRDGGVPGGERAVCQTVVLSAGGASACAAASDQAPAGRTVIVQAGNAPARATATANYYLATGADGAHVMFASEEDEDTPAPARSWMGVRLTAVPAPLAAHIGGQGVMIANVVKGSPADEAGLEQYDVITSYAGAEINEPADLTEALSATDPGNLAALTVVRGGQPQSLDIRPSERPQGLDEMEMKYDEPGLAFFNDAISLQGHTVQIGPDGEVTMEALGDLGDLSDSLIQLDDLFGDLAIELNLPQLPTIPSLSFGGSGQGPGVRVMVRVDDDGGQTVLRTETDGQIHIQRTDKDGNETSATYATPDELQEADPDAYELYEQCGPPGGTRRMHIRSFGLGGQDLRKKFRVDVNEKVREALERMQDARMSGGKFEEARDAAEQKLEIVREGSHGVAGSGKAATETRKVGDFRRLRLAGQGRLEVQIGQLTPLEITGDDNLLPLIETRSSNKQLVIGSKQPFNPKVPLVFKVGVPDLEMIDLTGAGDIKVSGLDNESFEIELKGAGNVELDGRTQRLRVNLAGAGNVLAAGLTAEEANVMVDGAGNADVNATGKLSARVSGVGNVTYAGSPEVSKRVTGLGAVKPKEPERAD